MMCMAGSLVCVSYLFWPIMNKSHECWVFRYLARANSYLLWVNTNWLV